MSPKRPSPAQPTLFTGAAKSSGSDAFDEFRDGLARDPALRGELEAAMQLNIDRVNPSDPGNRFVVGGAIEWLIAAAAWHLGILTIPGGHSERGFDLLELQEAARGLWSVKAQTAEKAGEYRITNGLGGSGKGFQDPTVFVSPNLPGLTLVVPTLHTDVAQRVKQTKDATVVPWGAIKAHATAHSECVAILKAPKNEGRGSENPFLAYAETLVDPQRFVRLSEMFTAAKPPLRGVADEVARLVAMHRAGDFTSEDLSAAIAALNGGG